MKSEIAKSKKTEYGIIRALASVIVAAAVVLIVWTGSLQNALAEFNGAPMYFISREDFEKQDFEVTEIDENHYAIEELSREDISLSLEKEDGIWRDSLSSPAGSHLSGMLVYFDEGRAIMQVEPYNMRGAQGNIINVWKTQEKYVHTIDFNMVGETFIIDEPGAYGMTGTVLETNPEIIELYWIPENDQLECYGNGFRYEGEEVTEKTAQKLIDELAMDYIPLETIGMLSGNLVSYRDGIMEVHNSLLSENCDYVDVQNGSGITLLLVNELKNCGLYEYGEGGKTKYTILCSPEDTEKQHRGMPAAVIELFSQFFSSVKGMIERILPL